MSRTSTTTIVFPRIASRDGPAKTLDRNNYVDILNTDQNPLFDPLRYGVSEEVTDRVANKRTLVTLHAPNTTTQLLRNQQRFRSNFKAPDQITNQLINRKRGR